MSFPIKACAALTARERAEILALQDEVYRAENLKNTVWLQTESHFDRTVPCFYLGYENGRLTSFLSLFLPTKDEAEVTAGSSRRFCTPPQKRCNRTACQTFYSTLSRRAKRDRHI